MKVLSLILTAALLVLANRLAADLKRQGRLPAATSAKSFSLPQGLHTSGQPNSTLRIP
jgi:hypothetical protein